MKITTHTHTKTKRQKKTEIGMYKNIKGEKKYKNQPKLLYDKKKL